MNMNKLPIKYWSIINQINYLQRQIIIYSIMYYELNESCISDKEFDKLSQQLIELMNIIPKKDLKKTEYYYCFYDYDKSTSFHIPGRLKEKDKEYLNKITLFVLRLYRSEEK